jgi:riboflavin kinase/FMN adenylyltransferase
VQTRETGYLQYTWIERGQPSEPRALAIGNFDGVHRGHQAVLGLVAQKAGERGLCPALLTFDPHPALVLGRPAPACLTTLARKADLARQAGIAQVLVRRFDDALSQWSPERFASELLASQLSARLVVVGDNFRFGHQRAGDLGVLRALGATLGFEVLVFPPQGDDAGPYSSTRVRASLEAGDVEAAAAVLGRPHSIEGVIESGAQRGRTLGFPTANFGGVAEMVPARGVYAVRVDVDGAVRDSVMNVGVRPTVGGTTPSIEAHLLDFKGDLYGKRLRAHFVARLRDELKFASLDALKAQIAQDATSAAFALAAASRPPHSQAVEATAR